ncbi:MAG: transposase [Deltaproteobacteria bacterium]|nr:transposase [Deltaproteobacteria bacterium]
MLKKRGVLAQDAYDDFAQEQPLLAGMTSASIIGLVSIGERAGQRVRRILQDPAEGVKTGHLCFASRGFSLHAARQIAAGNKHGLENLCNYVARPPLAAGSLQRISDEKYSFKLKTLWSDGTTHLILSPDELIEKLAALVPPPRQNLLRYHGVLAPHSKMRLAVVPKKPDTKELEKTRGKSKNRLLWAALLARTFNLQVEVCSCGGKMRMVAAITDGISIKKYLDEVGLPSEPPVPEPARPPPQEEFDYYFEGA